MRMLEGMTIHFDRVRALALTVVKDQKVIDDHRQICDAIERRDVAAAQEIMTKHLTRVKVDEASIRQACPEYIKTGRHTRAGLVSIPRGCYNNPLSRQA